MSMKSRLILWLAVLGIVDAIIPFFPILAFVLVYVLLEKPPWFLEAVQDVYKPG
jgi:hypothetical protein